MITAFSEMLSDEQGLAIAYTPTELRPQIEAYFALDKRLSQIVAKTTEPMLGQMRLAWWRDVLNQPVGARPSGDEVLDAIGMHWAGNETALVALVDAWEILIVEEKLGEKPILAFARGRAAPFSVLDISADENSREDIADAGTLWALIDAASQITDANERSDFLDVAKKLSSKPSRLPRSMRGLAVLRALAIRALETGSFPMMDGRGAALTALRVGLLGR
ncbi:hypothetical protein [Altererythrobacter lutimaris]|uniref:Phytoene synthase n=1 Tax=Altererythrobacter lutimaris TaxID=2743979 RepID=A0A850H4A8_9SPHN|nr:hypothetical protein [Altererythrobacter lutimaris]NVE93997.1 hypothetical protein [Altererythrobacter lutimaris]